MKLQKKSKTKCKLCKDLGYIVSYICEPQGPILPVEQRDPCICSLRKRKPKKPKFIENAEENEV